jgi:hypothetical protein
MAMKVRLVLLIAALVLASGVSWRDTRAQLYGQEEYFAETGHRVSGEFLLKYHSVPNPVELYGYPITGVFNDPTTNQFIQYFQKARFEFYPEAPVGQRVKVAPIGFYLYMPGNTVLIPANSAPCRTLPGSSFKVCYAFMNYFEANGGLEQFGPPISNTELENDMTVQYFLNARLEWHPELQSGQRVVVSDLGAAHFYKTGEDTSLLKPEQTDNTIRGILKLRARAFPLTAVTGPSGTQTIYVIVQDQRLLPVDQARVELVVRLPSGEEIRPALARTNDQGIAQVPFRFEDYSLGVVTIQVTASHENLKAQTSTSFRVWW